ncbi:MAG: transcriptional regulator MntR [Bacillota bacterium]
MLTESMEDYLESIYTFIGEKGGALRTGDLAEAQGVQPSSVSRMVKKLRRLGYLTHEKYGGITLTPRGRSMGRFLLWRDQMLRKFFATLGARDEADRLVESIEHFISPETMTYMRDLVEYFEANPAALTAYQEYRRDRLTRL